MRRGAVSLLLAILSLAALAPSVARAEVIAFDPRNDPVPEILSPTEMEKYDRLRPGGRPGILSGISPGGQYAFVSGVGMPGYVVLDVDSGTLEPFPADVWNPSLIQRASPFTWVSDTEAALLTCNRDQPSGPCEFAKTVVDAEAMTLQTETFEVAELEGKRVSVLTGRPLLRTTDGTFHVPAYTLQTGAVLESVRVPAYEAQTAAAIDARQALGGPGPTRLMLPTDELILAVSMEDGSLTTIGEVPAGTSLSTAVYSLAQRPDTDLVSYIVQPEISCAGIVQRQRSCRGGGMPTSYWLVQENLGRVPVEENRYVTETELRIVDLAGGPPRTVANASYVPGRFASTLWTADGERLLVASYTPSELEGRPHPVYGSPSGLTYKVFAPDGTYESDWQPDVMAGIGTSVTPLEGSRLAVTRPWNTGRQVYIVDAAQPDAEPTPVYTGTGVLYASEIGGAAFLFVMGDVTNPGELYLAELADVAATSRALSSVNQALLEVSDLKFETIAYTTSAGHDVEGIYVYPGDRPFPPDEPQPVVVWQQGGPGGQITNSWGTSVESPYSLLPNFGIPVFLVNGVGRLSNGPQFYSDMAEADNYGQRDILDVKEGVEHLIDLGVVDPDAVGVTGCSYGGYFTLQSLAEHPDFYAAGNTQCTLNDLIWEYNFGWAQTIAYLMGRSPAGDPDEYFRDSPTYRAYQIRAPLLVFHGTNDFLPFEHMTNVHDQVIASGIPSRFLRALGEGHGFGAPTSQRYAMQLQIDWFREHLGLTATLGYEDSPGGGVLLPLPARMEVGR